MPTNELKFKYLFEMGGKIIGPYKASDECLMFPITEGWFKGPKLQGRIVHGADCLATRASGVHTPNIRLTLQTDDGEYISMQYSGVVVFPEEVGEAPFVRTNPLFSASGKYSWLNKVVAVGVGKYVNMAEGEFIYDIYQIL